MWMFFTTRKALNAYNHKDKLKLTSISSSLQVRHYKITKFIHWFVHFVDLKWGKIFIKKNYTRLSLKLAFIFYEITILILKLRKKIKPINTLWSFELMSLQLRGQSYKKKGLKSKNNTWFSFFLLIIIIIYKIYLWDASSSFKSKTKNTFREATHRKHFYTAPNRMYFEN